MEYLELWNDRGEKKCITIGFKSLQMDELSDIQLLLPEPLPLVTTNSQIRQNNSQKSLLLIETKLVLGEITLVFTINRTTTH